MDADGIFLSNGTVIGNTIVANADFGIEAFSAAAYANNYLFGNNGGGPQVSGDVPLQPNLWQPACP